MPETIYPQFRDQNEHSRYPFSDVATLQSTTGYDFGVDTLLDARIHLINGGVGVALRDVTVTLDKVTLTVGDGTTSASADYDPSSPPSRLGLLDVSGRPAGLLLTDSTALAGLGTWPVGVHNFRAGSAEFVASCVDPMYDPTVVGLSVTGGVASGDIWLIGDKGVVLSVGDDGAIRVDAVGDPYALRAACDSMTGFVTPALLRTINGVGPDDFGAFHLVPADGVAGRTPLRIVQAGPGRLRVEVIGRLLESS